MISDKFVFLAIVFNFIGTAGYLRDTLIGRARPNRVSWSLWALAPLIAFAAELGEGVKLQSLLTFMVGFGPLLIVIASFVNRKASWKITQFDLACGGLSIIGLILWLMTGRGNLAIALSIASDALAALPTLRKSHSHPESESSIAFSMAGISAAITILTISSWTFANYGFPIYILVMDAVLYSLVRFKLGLRLQGKSA
jgi:hypothetical protein